MKNKFRASYTVLSAWASGNWERAIKTYFKLEDFATRAMVEGRAYHEKWSEFIQVHNKLPIEFGGKQLIKPQSEFKKVVQIHEWLELVGMIDCIDNKTIYEFKTGKQSSEKYASSPQAAIYAVLATYSKIYVNKAEIHHFDQYTKQSDMSIVWITDELLKFGYNYIITYASEMHNYFQQNDLYRRFSKNEKN